MFLSRFVGWADFALMFPAFFAACSDLRWGFVANLPAFPILRLRREARFCVDVPCDFAGISDFSEKRVATLPYFPLSRRFTSRFPTGPVFAVMFLAILPDVPIWR